MCITSRCWSWGWCKLNKNQPLRYVLIVCSIGSFSMLHKRLLFIILRGEWNYLLLIVVIRNSRYIYYTLDFSLQVHSSMTSILSKNFLPTVLFAYPLLLLPCSRNSRSDSIFRGVSKSCYLKTDFSHSFLIFSVCVFCHSTAHVQICSELSFFLLGLSNTIHSVFFRNFDTFFLLKLIDLWYLNNSSPRNVCHESHDDILS